MIDEKQFKGIAKKYSKVSSWAVWNPNNYKAVPDFEFQPKKMLNNVVILGLNVSVDITEPWQNFHSGPNDRKLMKAFNSTSYEGAYMTDLIKDKPESSSKKLMQSLSDKEKQDNFDTFFDEMKSLGATRDTLFILFGNNVKELFLESPVFKFNNILCCTHYAYYGITDNEWIKQVHSDIQTHQEKTKDFFCYEEFSK